MSQENVESFKRGAAAWNRGDFDAWIDHLDPEIEWQALMEVYRGHAGARHLWNNFKELELKIEFFDVRDLGERVLGLGEMKAQGQETRLDLSSDLATAGKVSRRQVVSFHDFGTHAEGLEAAGLDA
jgi:ketosteroid isomerase-like protein